MPTHAARSALIAAIQTVQSQNQNISDATQMDQVSIVSFDTAATVKQNFDEQLRHRDDGLHHAPSVQPTPRYAPAPRPA